MFLGILLEWIFEIIWIAECISRILPWIVLIAYRMMLDWLLIDHVCCSEFIFWVDVSPNGLWFDPLPMVCGLILSQWFDLLFITYNDEVAHLFTLQGMHPLKLNCCLLDNYIYFNLGRPLFWNTIIFPLALIGPYIELLFCSWSAPCYCLGLLLIKILIYIY